MKRNSLLVLILLSFLLVTFGCRHYGPRHRPRPRPRKPPRKVIIIKPFKSVSDIKPIKTHESLSVNIVI